MPDKPKISVVVPAYRRPEYLETLIKSYLLQDTESKELIILDDSGEDNGVEVKVREYTSKFAHIHYSKHPNNIGFCRNLIYSMDSGDGEYVVVLGDDDIFADKSSLTKYINIFEQHPDVAYVYSNQIQFNNNLQPDYIYPHFSSDKKYNAGWDAISNMWLLSCFISGMGFRRSVDLKEKYPQDNILFPQVEMVGKILIQYSSYAISEYLIGSRAHNEQLGFKAVKGRDIKNTERHSVYELGMVYDRVVQYASDHKIEIGPEYKRGIVNEFFENKHLTIYPGEKINTGNSKIISIFIQSVKNNPLVFINLRYMFYFLTALILPRSVLAKLKEWKKNQFLSGYTKQKEDFSKFIELIKNV